MRNFNCCNSKKLLACCCKSTLRIYFYKEIIYAKRLTGLQVICCTESPLTNVFNSSSMIERNKHCRTITYNWESLAVVIFLALLVSAQYVNQP